MRLRSLLAATALAGALAVIPMLAQSISPSLHTLLLGTTLLQSAPFHPERG